MTICAMVIGAVAAAISLVPFMGFVSFALEQVAMVLGIVGIAQRMHRRGFSVTALATGTLGLLVSILYTVLSSAPSSFPPTPRALVSWPTGPRSTRSR